MPAGRSRRGLGGLACSLAALALLAACGQSTQPPAEQATGPDAAPSSAAPEPGARPLLVIAHRGASAYAPHDTVAAAREAVDRGADALEMDVRQTRDGRLVALFHGSLAPTTDVEQVFPGRAPWRIESFTLAEVRRLDAGSWFDPKFADERVPTVRELAGAVEGSDVELILEPKDPRRYPGIADRVARAIRSDPSRYLEVECFDPAFLRRLATRSLPVDLGLTGTPPADELRAVASYADAVNPQLSTVDAAYVDRAHGLGLDVKVWSLNDRASMRQAVQLGVDGVYTHRPDLLNEVLGRQG